MPEVGSRGYRGGAKPRRFVASRHWHEEQIVASQTKQAFKLARGMPKTAAISIALLTVAGCSPADVSLAAVQQYAKTSAAASTSFDAIAADYYGSCLRRREYAQPATVGGQPLSSTMPPSPSPPPTAASGQPVPLTESANGPDCAREAAIAYRWQMENRVIVGYVRALGDVAGVDTEPENFDSLGDALASAGVIQSDPVATAAGKLAKSLAGALIAARQRKEIRIIVQSAKTAGLSSLVTDLQTASDAYVEELIRERTSVSSYYDTVLGGEQRNFALLECRSTRSSRIRTLLNCRAYGTALKAMTRRPARLISDEAAAAQLRDRMRTQRLSRLGTFNSIEERITAARAYADAIGAISSGNAALLAVPSNRLSAMEQAIRPFADALQDNVSAMVAALRK